MVKRLLQAGLLAGLCLSMTGCSLWNMSVEGLISAPKLSEEQTKIHESLIKRTGKNITLKYPQNGEYRSAFVITDLDGDGSNEAMAFYENTSVDSNGDGIRLNVLDQDSKGDWTSVFDAAGDGTDVDQVLVSKLGSDDTLSVLVGYKTINIEEKTLDVYRYEDQKLNLITTETYSVLDTMDINNDGYNEIFAIQQDSETASSQAFLLRMKDGALTKESSMKMASGSSTYVSYQKGKVTASRRGVFVDSLNADGMLQTEIVFYRYGTLQNPMAQLPDLLLTATVRQPGYYSTDIDGDGIVEIPVTSIMRGYEQAEATDVLYETTWYSYEDFYQLKKKYIGYYSVSSGYAMMFPSRWQSLVMVKKDTTTGELVFYKYEGNLEDSTTELMRIVVSPKSETADYEYDGYELITSQGQLDYLVKRKPGQLESLVLTLDEVRNNFYVI